MKFAQTLSYWVHAGQKADFFRKYKKDVHEYTVSFASIFYKVMGIVFAVILIVMSFLPKVEETKPILRVAPFVAVYAVYMGLCFILFETIIKKHISASFHFTQITLLFFGILLLWLNVTTAETLAVFIPVYFVLFPLLVTVPIPILILDLLILYAISIAGTVLFKAPATIQEDIINITICMAAGFFIGCKNIRSRLMEIKTSSKEEKHNALQKSVIDALIDEYECLAMVDLDKDTIKIVLINDNFSINTDYLLKITSLSERVAEYAEKDVYEEDRARYLSIFNKKNVIEHMKHNDALIINFRVLRNGQTPYVQTKIIKDINAPMGANRFIMSHRSIDTEVKMEQMVSNAIKLASQDPLTGVNNRTAFERDKEEIEKKIISGELKQAGIVIFDVNWLKETNDYKGHAAGDELLKNVCKKICDIYKHSPVYRIGGDEFSVLLSSYDMRNRTHLLESVKRASSRKKDGISYAAGMAIYTKEDSSFDKAIVRADEEMYKMKKEIKRPYIIEEQKLF
ncbi:MAG: diguanylate cyclase [Treponemataceae bacterium]|nr:diguanylate cyclase [Treponemataceae bacterium]